MEALGDFCAKAVSFSPPLSRPPALCPPGLRTLAPFPYPLGPGYCNLNFDPTTASEELFLFKETHSVLNLGILLEPFAAGGPFPGFKQWPQVLCSRGLAEGRHYWEADVSNSWVCLGVTYRRSPPLGGRPRRNIVIEIYNYY